MTDLALAWIGGTATGVTAGGVSAAARTQSSANNNPAVLNKPMRRASRRDSGRLRLMPMKFAAGDGRWELGFVLIIWLSLGWCSQWRYKNSVLLISAQAMSTQSSRRFTTTVFAGRWPVLPELAAGAGLAGWTWPYASTISASSGV